MNIAITDEERNAVRHALEYYVSGLSTEIGKTDSRDWKKSLHEEKDLLNEAIKKLSVN